MDTLDRGTQAEFPEDGINRRKSFQLIKTGFGFESLQPCWRGLRPT